MIISRGFEEHVEVYRGLNCQVILVHGQITDAFYIKAERTVQPEFAEMLTRIRDEGFVPAMSTHNAGEVLFAAEAFDAAAVNTPINKIMWRMCPCEEMVLNAIGQTRKKVIAINFADTTLYGAQIKFVNWVSRKSKEFEHPPFAFENGGCSPIHKP